MVTQLTFNAPCVKLQNLDNLWLQLSSVACNLKCKHCHLSCMPSNKKKSFIHLDKIKQALEEVKNHDLKNIYLTGGEPLLHPDFNNIVRMSLKKCSVTILTNGTLINDKKARFLRQIENDHDNEIIFRVSIDHYTEEKNDEIRGKGSFKKAVAGVNNLVRYGFNPIISIVNIWNEDEKTIKERFSELFMKYDFETEEINFKIIPPVKTGEFAKNYGGYGDIDIVQQEDIENIPPKCFDCSSSRVITENGVYSCPLLVDDPRGKVGNTLSDSSKRVYLETNICSTCAKHNKNMLCNSW